MKRKRPPKPGEGIADPSLRHDAEIFDERHGNPLACPWRYCNHVSETVAERNQHVHAECPRRDGLVERVHGPKSDDYLALMPLFRTAIARLDSGEFDAR